MSHLIKTSEIYFDPKNNETIIEEEIEHSLVKFEGDIEGLLEAALGWNDFAIITKEEFNALNLI